MKNITILGATGSIGRSALNVYKNFSDELHIHAISVHTDIQAMLRVIDQCQPDIAVVADSESCRQHFGALSAEYGSTKIICGSEGLQQICSDGKADIVLNAISGQAGLLPSVWVLSSGTDLALANKESMVCGGDILRSLSAANGGKIIPVDSEHSAIFQLLRDKSDKDVTRLIITASGGPFRTRDKATFADITVAEALAHPTWSMGRKISIDSATLANKGLEVIEAHQLFGFDYDRINVLVHPQSLIHSMIEMTDGEIYAQIGPKDMSLPIQNSLFYPDIRQNGYNRLDLTKGLTLELLPIDMDKFRMLSFAYHVGRRGGLWTSFYNSVNEILVARFLNEKIRFTDIESGMERALEYFDADNCIDKATVTLENIQRVQELSGTIVQKLFGD